MLKATLLMLIGLVYGLFSLSSLLDGRAIESRGKTAQIEPLETYTQVTRKKPNRPADISYKGEIRFVTETGQAVTVKRSLTPELLESMRQGQPVLIRYLPDKPTKTRLEDEKSAGALDVAIGAIALLLSGLWFRKKLNEPPSFRE